MTVNALAPSPPPRRDTTYPEATADATGRHRFDVIASSVSDVVRNAGGWLADRVLAGWDVTVYLPETDDITALRIIGVTARSMAEVESAGSDPQRPTAVAVSADAVSADPRVRARLAAEFDRDIAEVTVWGDTVPDGLGEQFRPVQHIPSAAARAFKSHAMRAAAMGDEEMPATEAFHIGSSRCGTSERPQLSAVDGSTRPALPAVAVWAPAPFDSMPDRRAAR